MPSKVEDDWSSSDEDDAVSQIETSVLLGVPDGPIDSPSELLDAAVSRIGGHPAFLSSEPPITSSQCKHCSFPMELLVQMWCPLEDSPLDRALYVWGCARAECQRKEGSVRACRGLRYNEEYAKKLEKKLIRRREKEAAAAAKEKEAAKKAAASSNPFSMGASSDTPNPFGLGSQIFSADPPPASTKSSPTSPSSDSEEDSESEDSSDTHSLITALASTTLRDSAWSSAPSYPPLYLSTAAESIPPPPKASKIPKNALVDVDAEGDNKGGWVGALEGYENSLEVDHVFERFTKRVGYEGEQCIRYELGGTPLPFSSDKTFDALFPLPKPTHPTPITRSHTLVQPQPPKRTYDPTSPSIPPCPHCSTPRIFECQLMPNLINVLRSTATTEDESGKKQTDEERRKELETVLKGGGEGKEGRRGMEWGTCLVFSCEKDCIGEGEKEGWREEFVLVQWDE